MKTFDEPSKRSRYDHAEWLGRWADLAFETECRRLGLDPEKAIEAPLVAIATQQETLRQYG